MTLLDAEVAVGLPWESPLGRVDARPVEPARDLALLHRWVTHPRSRFWGMQGWSTEQVREELEVDPQRTLAVGDQRNDLEMLRWAARGVAMGQAPDEVVAAADEVTAPVEQDGLALVLEGLVGEAASA